MAAEVVRTPVWADGGVKITLVEYADGSLALMRSTDFDGGPARTCPIPAAAVPSLIAALQNFRACGGC
jgi:hypothetical protein